MITVYLRKTTGKGEKLQVSPKITSQALFQEVCKVLNYPVSQDENLNPPIDCFYRGVKLEKDSQDDIQDLGITGNSIIHVVQAPSTQDSSEDNSGLIRVKLIIKNKLFEYDISQENTIEDLKQNICEDLQIKEEDLTLSYIGIELDDAKTVKEHQLSEGVLLSASVNGDISSPKFTQTHSVSKQSYSEESEGIPKIIRKNSSPLKKIKKAESMNVQPNIDLKSKNINFCSVRLNKIEQKNDESKIESQINESEQNSEEVSDVEETAVWEKPKLTLDLLGKPWYGDQKIIQTESIVGDEEPDEILTECFAEFTRIDKKRQYVLECSTNHTFEDAQKTIARLQKLEPSNIKILFNFDEVSKSGISSRSSKGIQKSPKSSESIKKQRSSYDGARLSVHRGQGVKTKIVELAAKKKSKMISIQFESFRDI